jgi:hypothetical protein
MYDLCRSYDNSQQDKLIQDRSIIMKTAYIISAFLLLVLASTSVMAQSNDRILEPGVGLQIMIGPYGGVDVNMHQGEFYTTQNGIVCCQFEEGSGIGAAAGVKGMIQLAEDFSLSPRILYEDRGGTFISREENYPILGEGNRVERVTFENRLDVSLHTLNIDLLGTYTVAPFGLYVAAGPTASVVIGQSFSKKISIYSPTGVRFLNGSTTMSVDPGEQDIVRPLLFSARGGLGAMLQLGESIHLNPEVLYTLPFGRLSKQDNWKASSIQATLGVMVTL